MDCSGKKNVAIFENALMLKDGNRLKKRNSPLPPAGWAG